MIVLGLDPSLTNFGWAFHDTDSEGRSRCVERGRFQTKASMEFVDRYVYLRERLRLLIRSRRPDRVSLESPVYNNLYSEGMYGLYLYVCEALKLEGMDVVLWSPLQVKAHAREFLDRPKIDGKVWKMMKPDMVEAAKEDTGGKGRWNHNEADAYLVAKLGGRFWKLLEGYITEADLTDVESKYFTEVKTYQRGKKAGKVEYKGVIYRESDRFFLWSKELPDASQEED